MSNAFVFPGQGSQAVGMLDDLARHHPVVRRTFASASEVLGYDLWRRVSEGPRETLDSTLCTQPAMLTAGVATWRVWRDEGGNEPQYMAGHSLGEFTALVCAGALDFEAAVDLVEKRAGLMQNAVAEGEGAMAAVLGLSDEEVERACGEAAGDEVVEAANYNAPGQVVVAGHASAVARLRQIASDMGARRVLPLPVSVPSHCALMRGAAHRFADLLEDIELRPVRIPVLHNAGPVDADDARSVRAALCRQLYSPVRWRATVEELAHAGVDRFYECGPGKVLSGLIRRTSRELQVVSLHDDAAVKAALPEQVA